MTPAVNPKEVLQACSRRMEFPMTKFLWTYLFIGVARGGNRPYPNWNATNDKNNNNKALCFFSVPVSLSIFAYNSIRLQQTNTNNQVGGLSPPKQIFAIQFKCITRIYDKTKISQGKYSIDLLLLKLLQEAMYFASSTWTKSITKFNPKFKILNVFWLDLRVKGRLTDLIVSIGFQFSRILLF